tara:strand:- start:955 stop:1566 length:612 start_codon:yes stop_codon:yes gene_type:complete
MKWGELKTHVKRQVVNQTIPDLEFTNWQDVCLSRITRDARPKELIQRATITPTAFPHLFSQDVEEIIDLTTPGNGTENIRLRRASRETMAEFKLETGGTPRYYVQNGQSIEIYQNGLNREYTLVYLAKDGAMTGDNEQNTTLRYNSYLWVYALMHEAYMYMRDFEAAREARTLYDAEVASLNAADAMKQSAEAPQASGAWAWS